jgi:ABC-type protease/lipase transport system fused ATPase/permease subunit
MVDDILQFLESSELSDFLFPFKVLFIVISIAFIFAIFYYYIKAGFLIATTKRRINDFLSFQKFDSKKILTQRAKKISTFLNKRDYKRAILMMEELLIDALKDKGVRAITYIK